jgi:phenylpyruvate tautomerase PptA (4-oxalocrotonate tautomerase family)
MPFVRIDVPSHFSEARLHAVADAVHASLVQTFNVPQDDRFQALQRHAAGELAIAPSYLGISHGRNAVLVQITCSEGRSIPTKKALFAAIASSVAEAGALPPADVIVHLLETKKENWSFGNGIAQYATGD